MPREAAAAADYPRGLRPGGRTEGAELCCSAQSVLADYKDMLMQIFRYYAAGEKVSCMAAAALLLKGGSSGPSASAGCMGRVGAAQDRIGECGHAAAGRCSGGPS